MTDVTLSAVVPVIETERLVLREPREADFEDYAAFSATERTRFIGGVLDRFQAWRGMLGTFGHWVLRGYGFWTVDERDSGRLAGRVGFIYHDGWSEPELGWHVFDGFEGRGIAHEAALAAREAGARRFGLDGVISHIHPDNARSRRLAERMGAVIERETELLGNPCLIYRHPKVLK